MCSKEVSELKKREAQRVETKRNTELPMTYIRDVIQLFVTETK